MTGIPEQFLNVHYVEEKQTNLDDFLSLRGVPWLVRKMISGKLKNGQFHLALQGDGYTYKTADPSKKIEYNFKLGETFTATGYDGKQHKITISMDGDRMKEVHLNLERDVGEDVFYFYFKDGILYSDCAVSKGEKTALWRRQFCKKY